MSTGETLGDHSSATNALHESLARVRRHFAAYVGSGRRALDDALAIGRCLHPIKSALLAGKAEFAAKTWKAWCVAEHKAKRLPFGRRQADRYIALWNTRDRLAFESDTTSVRAGIARVTADKGAKQRPELWKRAYPIKGRPKGQSIHVSSKGRVRVTFGNESLGDVLDPDRAANNGNADQTTFESHQIAQQMLATLSDPRLLEALIASARLEAKPKTQDAEPER